MGQRGRLVRAGAGIVGLFWLGRRIDPNPAAIAPWPKWFVPAAFGACLLSPHHVFALRLPIELSPAVWMRAFRSDPRFAGVFAHPWHWGPLGEAGGYSPAAWAFFALLALGIVSFAANRPAVRSWRFAVWLPFAALAAWQVRLIPLFAIVAAPIAAINLGEIVRNGANARPGRLLAIAGVLALLTVNWFSGLAGTIARDRTPAWAVYSDPTLERAAKGIVGWRHANGIPTEARIFATHPDVGHYLAWHAPSERYFLDSRLTLFTDAADEFAALSRSTGILPEDNATPLPTDVAAILLYDSNAGRMTRALAQDRESVLRIDGTAVLLARPGSVAARGSMPIVPRSAGRANYRSPGPARRDWPSRWPGGRFAAAGAAPARGKRTRPRSICGFCRHPRRTRRHCRCSPCAVRGRESRSTRTTRSRG